MRDNGSFRLGDSPGTLASALRAAGYETGAFVGAFVLDRRWGIAQGFERYFDEFDLSKYDGVGMDTVQRPGGAVVDEALRWLADEPERPFFAWVHLYDPHAPYEAPEPFRSQFPATQSGAYDAEVAASDSFVGRLLDRLAADGRLERTLVALAAAHGLHGCLLEHGRGARWADKHFANQAVGQHLRTYGHDAFQVSDQCSGRIRRLNISGQQFWRCFHHHGRFGAHDGRQPFWQGLAIETRQHQR